MDSARTVVQGGRAKAFRPLPAAAREEAFAAGVAAFERGDFFEAHELLEPAWMGTDDLVERDLYQGLIKLAAAFVHEVRGNRRGTVKNLRGARERLARSLAAGGDGQGLDLPALIEAIDGLGALAEEQAAGRLSAPVLARGLEAWLPHGDSASRRDVGLREPTGHRPEADRGSTGDTSVTRQIPDESRPRRANRARASPAERS